MLAPDDLRTTLHAALDKLLDALEARAQAPADELVALEDCGLERRAVDALRRAGRLPCVKLGRRWYTRRSAVLALCPEVGTPVLPPEHAAPEERDDLAAAALKRALRKAASPRNPARVSLPNRR
jgi:hypothetical protein